MPGETHIPLEALDEQTRLRMAEAEIAKINKKREQVKRDQVNAQLKDAKSIIFEKGEEDFEFPKGTNPGFAKEQTSVSGVLEAKQPIPGSDISEDEEWQMAITKAKQKIAAVEELEKQIPSEGKGVDLREKIKTAVSAHKIADAQLDNERWEAAELKARKQLGLDAHAKEEKQANKSGIQKLMARLGLGRKNK